MCVFRAAAHSCNRSGINGEDVVANKLTHHWAHCVETTGPITVMHGDRREASAVLLSGAVQHGLTAPLGFYPLNLHTTSCKSIYTP